MGRRTVAAATAAVAIVLTASATAGPPQSTDPVAPLGALPASSEARDAVAYGDSAVFVADDDEHGKELWITDGTAEGTSLLADVDPGQAGSNPVGVTTVGDEIFFAADDGVHGQELWRSDGTPGGAELVADINPGPGGSNGARGVAVDGAFFFSADDGVHGLELWRSDGTQEGTALMKDVAPGPNGGALWTEMAAASGKLIFTARSPDEGEEVWVSDGTADGTRLLVAAYPGPRPGSPKELKTVGNEVFFLANSPDPSESLNCIEHCRAEGVWRTDGSVAGTQLVSGIDRLRPAGPSAASPREMYFFSTGAHLWRSDGTAAGTGTLERVPGHLHAMDLVGGKLYFAVYVPPAQNEEWDWWRRGVDPWVSDGTAGGTFQLTDVPGSLGAGCTCNGFYGVNGAAFFWTGDGTERGPILWMSNGTRAGTRAVMDFDPEFRNSAIWEKRIVSVGDRLILAHGDIWVGRPGAEADPAGLRFNGRRPRITTYRWLDVHAGGPAPLEVEGVAISGTDGQLFHVEQDECSGKTILTADRCRILLAFRGPNAERRSARLELRSNDASSPLLVRLSARPLIPDRVAPRTRITAPRQVLVAGRRARLPIRLRSSEAGVIFRCQVNRGAWRRCARRPFVNLKVGANVVRARATDPSGNVGRAARAVITVRRRPG